MKKKLLIVALVVAALFGAGHVGYKDSADPGGGPRYTRG